MTAIDKPIYWIKIYYINSTLFHVYHLYIEIERTVNYSIIAKYLSQKVYYPKIWLFTLLTFICASTLLPMEVYSTKSNTTSIHDEVQTDGLTQVRKYLLNRTNAKTVITETLNQQANVFKEMHTAMAQITPTTTLTPTCYIAFENKNEPIKGTVKRQIHKINADRTGLTSGDDISLKVFNNGTFKTISSKAHNFNEPVPNLIPSNQGYYFILKGENAPEKNTCLSLLKTISQINDMYVEELIKKQISRIKSSILAND